MNRHLIEKRNKIINEIWEEEKAEMPMELLADIFKISLPTIYRILKQRSPEPAGKSGQINK